MERNLLVKKMNNLWLISQSIIQKVLINPVCCECISSTNCHLHNIATTFTHKRKRIQRSKYNIKLALLH